MSDWECRICGEWADNRLMLGTPQTYWYTLWYCDEHVVEGCEKQAI